MEIRAFVPPYIARFLSIEYGPGPYLVAGKQNRDIRAALLYGEIWCDAFKPVIESSEAKWLIYIYVEQPDLLKLFKSEEGKSLSRNGFFQHEFWNTLLGYVQGYMDAAGSKGTIKAALATFLARYDIDEDILALDSVYKQYYRLVQVRENCRQIFNPPD